ncbi:MAG TPA: phosphatase PAP2 family protein [Burkholderiales bacterium]|nr:phosphatase PAP2 family protein [Burkholderiales bacterium]
MRSDLRAALYIALALFGVGMALGWVGLGPTPAGEILRHLRYPMLSLSAGPFAALFATVFFCAIADRRAVATVGAAGVAGALGHLAIYGIPQVEGIERVYCVLTFALWLGAASLAALGWLAWRGAETRRAAREALAGCFFILLWSAFLSTYLQATIELHSTTYDAMLYRFEATLGFQVAPRAARAVAGAPAARDVLDAIYDYQTFGYAALYGLTLRRRAEPPVDVLLVWAVGAACAFAAHHLLPAAGPRYLLGERFPDNLPALAAVPDARTAVQPWPRDAIPALHVAWAIVFWAYARVAGWRWIARACLAALALIVVAALARGEHYLIDIVVTVPFVAGVLGACLRNVSWLDRSKRLVVASGFGLWLAWVAALRFGLKAFETAPGLAWLAIAVTLYLSVSLYRTFFRLAAAR